MTMYPSEGTQLPLASDVRGFYGSYGMSPTGYGEMAVAERSPYNHTYNDGMLSVAKTVGFDVPGVYLSIVHLGYVLLMFLSSNIRMRCQIWHPPESSCLCDGVKHYTADIRD